MRHHHLLFALTAFVAAQAWAPPVLAQDKPAWSGPAPGVDTGQETMSHDPAATNVLRKEPSDALRVSMKDIIGKDVLNDGGLEVGSVEDVLIDPRSGQARMLVIRVSGFPGVDEKTVAVDMNRVRFEPVDPVIIVSGLDPEAVKAMPAFDRDQASGSSGQASSGGGKSD